MTYWLHKKIGIALAATTLLAAFVPATPAASEGKVIECTVIIDQRTGENIVRRGNCSDRFTPMSTFKVPLALMGYDAGILEDERQPRWDYRKEFDAPKRARKPVDPTVWEKDSIVWYSQEIARKLGEERFGQYVDKLDYGNMDVDGLTAEEPGLTHSWLASSLLISADEQARLMRRIVARDLPLSEKALTMTLAIVPAFETADGWRVHGKTGSGPYRDSSGDTASKRPIGWFVGWAEKDGRKVAFARLKIFDRKPSKPSGPTVRDMFLGELPSLMKSQ